MSGSLIRFGVTRLYRDASSMAIASIANAALGVVFWAVAAKLFVPHELGVMTAVLSVITSVGVVVASGIGDSYTALLPALGGDRSHFYRRGQRIFLALAVVSAMASAWCIVSLLDTVSGSVGLAVLVAVGVLLWSAVVLQNSTLVALGRARWLPVANIALSAGKLVLLLLFAGLFSWHPVELSVVAAALAIVAVLQPLIRRIVDSGEDLPPSRIAGGLGVRHFYTFVMQTTVSSALSMGLFLVTPFLVTVFAGPAQGALFALSLALVQSLDLIGAAMSMSLVVHASSSPEDAGVMARSILFRSTVLSVVGAAFLVAVAPYGMRFLNAQYGAMGATSVIATLAVGTICRLLYQVWSGLQRARRSMLAPLVLNVISAAILLGSLPALCRAHGALGGAFALLLAQLGLAAGIVMTFVIGHRRRSEIMSGGSWSR